MNTADIKFLFSLFFAKTSSVVLKNIIKTNATSLPGKLIFKFNPNFLAQTNKHCKKGIITITGTNGKTTTAGMIAQIFKSDNNYVVHNTEGANMLTGMATAAACGLKFCTDADYFVFESDEAYLSKLYDYVTADCLVVTNLFRDQLDRYGELATTAEKIKSAILKNKNLKVFLNADDPMLQILDVNEKIVWYGFDDIDIMCGCETGACPTDNISCKCGNEYTYTKRFYSHIGHYECSCGHVRPRTNYSASAKIFEDYSEIIIKK